MTTNTAFADALRHSTMLVTLTTNTFGIQRTQRDLSDTIATETNGNSRAFAVRKNLLAGADSQQRDLVAIIAAFRTFLYRKTLPFASSGMLADRGPRIVANMDFADIHDKLGKARAELNAKLDAFGACYDDAIETARSNLGTAFDPDDYPPFDEVRDSFRIDVEFQPLPARGTFGNGLDKAIALSLDDEIEERQTIKAKVAIDAMRERARELLLRYRDRATAAVLHDRASTDRKPRITASMFEAAKEVADAITVFSPLTMLDPGLTKVADALMHLSRFTIVDLYDSPRIVEAALDELEAAL